MQLKLGREETEEAAKRQDFYRFKRKWQRYFQKILILLAPASAVLAANVPAQKF